jgi:hypothetical protein
VTLTQRPTGDKPAFLATKVTDWPLGKSFPCVIYPTEGTQFNLGQVKQNNWIFFNDGWGKGFNNMNATKAFATPSGNPAERWKYWMTPFGESVSGVTHWRTDDPTHDRLKSLPNWKFSEVDGPVTIAPAPSADPAKWPAAGAQALPHLALDAALLEKD